MLEGEDNDSKAKIQDFEHKLTEHLKHSHMKSFFTKDKRKRTRTDGDEDAGAGAGGSGAADHAALRAHGYEVKLDTILDAKGIPWESLSKVRLVFSTYYMAC